MLFEGEYLNGKKWKGKLTTYFNGELRYDGELLNGKKHGKAKRYYEGILIFEGEYLNGKIWNGKGFKKDGTVVFKIQNGNGNVLIYNKDDKLDYDLTFLKGERNGKAKEYSDGKLLFEGEYLDDLKNGEGKEYNMKGELIFDGEYLNGKKWKGRVYEHGKYIKDYYIEGKRYYNNKKA